MNLIQKFFSNASQENIDWILQINTKFENYLRVFDMKKLSKSKIAEDHDNLAQVKNEKDFLDFCKNANGLSWKLCLWAIENKTIIRSIFKKDLQIHHCCPVFYGKLFPKLSFIQENWNLIAVTLWMHYLIHHCRYEEYGYIQDSKASNLISVYHRAPTIILTEGSETEIKNKITSFMLNLSPAIYMLTQEMEWHHDNGLKVNYKPFEFDQVQSILNDLIIKSEGSYITVIEKGDSGIYVRFWTYLTELSTQVNLRGWSLVNKNKAMLEREAALLKKKKHKLPKDLSRSKTMIQFGGYVWKNEWTCKTFVVEPNIYQAFNELVLELVWLTPKEYIYNGDFEIWKISDKVSADRFKIETNFKQIAQGVKNSIYGWSCFDINSMESNKFLDK